nr:hypothetical protein GCM10020093_101210 [Planobispora longispora]
MRRKARLVPILTLAVGSALLPATIAYGDTAAVAPATPQPAEKEAADTASEQRVVQRYWTEAKMEAAQPLDSLAPKKEGIRLTAETLAAQTAARPVSIPATTASGDAVTPSRPRPPRPAPPPDPPGRAAERSPRPPAGCSSPTRAETPPAPPMP